MQTTGSTTGTMMVQVSGGVDEAVRVNIRVRRVPTGFFASAKVGNRGAVAKLPTRGAALAWAFAEAQGMIERGAAR